MLPRSQLQSELAFDRLKHGEPHGPVRGSRNRAGGSSTRGLGILSGPVVAQNAVSRRPRQVEIVRAVQLRQVHYRMVQIAPCRIAAASNCGAVWLTAMALS